MIKVTNETRYNYEEKDVIFAMSTAGGRYQFEVYQDEQDKSVDRYSFNHYTGGNASGGGFGYTRNDIAKYVYSLQADSARIDGINYKVTVNQLGLELA